MKYVLTEKGKENVRSYIRELEAKRKEILDAGKDTADETAIPTAEDILSDVSFMGINWGDPDGPCYYNGWRVTDNHEADAPILLKLGRDLIIEDDSPRYMLISVTRCDLEIAESFYLTKEEAVEAMINDIIDSTPYESLEEIIDNANVGYCGLSDDESWAETTSDDTCQWKIVELPAAGQERRSACKATPVPAEAIRYTDTGLKVVENYIAALKTKQEAILKSGTDTADETTLPTPEVILSDILFIGINWDTPDGPWYLNSWGVTDEPGSDYPICLFYGKDFVPVDKDADKVISVVLANNIDLPDEAAHMRLYGKCKHEALQRFSSSQIMAAMKLF